MTEIVPTQEGVISYRNHDLAYRIAGEGEAEGSLPLLVLHGGPGASYDYLRPLENLAQRGRRVIFYDQLGSGRSDHPDDPSLWTVDYYVAEIEGVREALGLERIHLLGHSWGGMLGMEYALTQPDGLESFTIASSPASAPLWVSEANRLLSELPWDIQDTIRQHEAAGTIDSPEFQAASLQFYQRHVCRLNPWPPYVTRSFEFLAKYPQVYNAMQGHSEFVITGSLKDWDVTSRLKEITVPVLITSGGFDEATPSVAGAVHSAIQGSQWILFENSAHMAHAEETERYMQVLGEFLGRVEQKDVGGQ
ncbi:MAG: proline iminopeptidase-family hydrolase [Chloroflexota bacterium]|nr:proline iminopeptidase-family hydrolase [Chloroflexota bacterium]